MMPNRYVYRFTSNNLVREIKSIYEVICGFVQQKKHRFQLNQKRLMIKLRYPIVMAKKVRIQMTMSRVKKLANNQQTLGTA